MEQSELHIEYKTLINVAKKRIYIILPIIIIALGFSILYRVKIGKPIYEAKASLIMGYISDFERSDLQNYIRILKTNMVAERTINSLSLNISMDDFKKRIQASQQPGTQFMDIKITWENPKEAGKILDTLCVVFIEEALRIFPEYEIKVLEKTNPCLIQVLNDKSYYLLAVLGSFLISSLTILIMAYIDDTINSEVDIEKTLNIPVIGTIPKHKKIKNIHIKTKEIVISTLKNEYLKSNGYSSLEAYRLLRTNLYYTTKEQDIKTIVVTSARPGEGKSITASMLAVVLAQGGKQTLLIDCDLRKPDIHKIFNLENKGLTDILIEETDCKDLFYKTEIENLYVLPAGSRRANPVELISSDGMKELISYFRESFDYIIFDAPSVGLVADAQVLSQFSDGYLFVISSGKSNKDAIKKALKLIQFTQGRILGVLLNNASNSTYKYSRYYT